MLFDRRGIVVACDLGSLKDLDGLVEATVAVREVTGFKVGFSLALRYGLPQVVERIRARTDKPVIYDHQKAASDIPEMGAPFAEVCAESGVDGVILFPHAGPATLEAWVDAVRRHELTPIVGAVMTHPRFLASEGGFILDEANRAIYRIALDHGVVHFVLPATKPEQAAALREAAQAAGVQEVVVLTPGVGRQKADTAALRDRFQGFTWSPIVGSAIYEADDPADQARALARELELLA
jgi:orotidine-5'-phosphate decarboxylase